MSLPKSSTPLNDPAHLLDLVSTIQTSVQDIIGEYQAVGAVVPPLTDTDVTSGPLDRPEDMTPKLLHAVHLIEAACVQLCATVFDDNIGQTFGIYIIAVAGAESVIGLSILIAYYRLKGSISLRN